MQYIVLLGIVISIIAIIIFITNIKKKKKKGQIISGLILIASVIFIIWYFTPITYKIPSNDEITINVIYTYNNINMSITDSYQKREIMSLVNDLQFTRGFLNDSKYNHINNKNYVYLTIYNSRTDELYFHVGLHLIINEDSEKNYYGFCFNNNYEEATNSTELINYIRSLMRS